MNKPVISVCLKPHLADFCRSQFKLYNDHLILSRTKPAGKFIISHILTSDMPVKRPFSDDLVSFILPNVTATNLENKFLYVSRWGEQQINDYLQALFDIEVKYFFLVGYELKFTQKEIADGFVEGYNMKKNAVTFDMIKKNDQRKKKFFRKNVSELIQGSKKQSVKKFI